MVGTTEAQETVCALYVDMGTTNTRVWLMRGDQMLGSVSDTLGIRDAAREGGQGIRKGLGDLISKACQTPEGTVGMSRDLPAYIVGAGMIGSNLGLAEVRHIQAPAEISDLAAGAQWHYFADISDLPFLLIPGVRSGPVNADPGSINQADVMRGEETLCVGLVMLRTVAPPAVVLNLGSHWKAIQLETSGTIRASVTSLSGELIHAAQSCTILAGSVSREWPTTLSPEWIEAGMAEQRRSGLARALFCARLLDLAGEGSPEDRLAFVVGAFIASDLDALLAHAIIASRTQVALVGHPAIAEAWQTVLSGIDIQATIVNQQQAEKALLAAMQRILLTCALSANRRLRRALTNG